MRSTKAAPGERIELHNAEDIHRNDLNPAWRTQPALSHRTPRAVENLTRTEAARESERLRSALLDSVTHELRTPLTAIKASVTHSEAKLTQEDQQDLLAVIEEESDRLNRLVGEAVEMAQLDAKEVKLDLRPEQIREPIEAAMAEAKHALSNHAVQARLPESMPPALMDAGWIKKVLQHLLENAAKYSPAGSPIYISAEVRNDRLITSVADRGAGIDDLERSMVFDKFIVDKASATACREQEWAWPS
jgi:two-component system sensor histidine kinase KdpD